MEYDIFIAAAHTYKPAKTRADILLNLAGPEAIEWEHLFVYAAEVYKPGADGAVITPAESREVLSPEKEVQWNLQSPKQQDNGKTQV